MLRGELVGLRARAAADVVVLHEAFHNDIWLYTQMNNDPWRPIDAAAEDGPFAVSRPRDDTNERFTVVALADDAVVGQAVMWGIDPHNRSAHLGLGLLPEARGRGMGADIVNVLCHYGFVMRGFRRLQLETLASNAAMIAAAQRGGFVLEGTMRGAAWVDGEVVDEIIYGLLADEWTAR